MATLFALLLVLAAEQAQVPATLISKEEHEAVLKEQIAKKVVDQPIKASDVPGGRASVAMLHRVKPEASALIHDYVTETYYIVSGSEDRDRRSPLARQAPSLTRVKAGRSRPVRASAANRKGKAGIIMIPRVRRTLRYLDGRSATVNRFERQRSRYSRASLLFPPQVVKPKTRAVRPSPRLLAFRPRRT